MGTRDLAPDQRAVLELVLRQGRSYGELSELLGIPEHDVRARADAGVRVLAGEPAAGVDSGRIADWLLGQQPAAEAERTSAAVARDAAARAWAQAAAERLRELGGDAVPEVAASAPHEARGDAVPRPRPRADRDAGPPPRSSRLGGALLIGALVLVVGGVLFAVLQLTGDDGDSAASPQAQQEPQPSPTPEATGSDIPLRGTGGSEAVGLMRLIRAEDGSVQFAIGAEGVPPNEGREVYAVWFTRENGDARRLGFAQTQVGEEGVLTTGGPQPRDRAKFPRWFATFDKVLVTRESDAKADEPGAAVLEGDLP
jgi:hypothetical protein